MDALLLNLLIFLPLAAAVLIWALPQQQESQAGRIALLVGFFAAAVGLLLWAKVDATNLVGVTDTVWFSAGEKSADADGSVTQLSGIQIRYHVGIDAISAPLLALTALLIPIGVACSFTAVQQRRREYYAWLMFLTGAMFGVFAARDVLLFYVFFEFTLVPMYFLIGIWGGAERRRAANMFFLYTFVGSVITFAGILYLAFRAAQLTASQIVSFDLQILSTLSGLTTYEQSLLFLAMFCGFAIKVPFFPLHTWLPLAHTEAPTAGSVILAGVLLKLGTYGFLRLSLPVVPEGAVIWAQWMGGLACAGIIYGALCSWVQNDVKKLVAYSSVSHLGFCMLGMFSLLPVGISGAVLYMVNHGLSTGALFLIVGMIYERYHTRDMDKVGGLAKRMPIMTFFLIFFTLASIGLPGLNGFVSEFTTLLAAYNSPVLGPAYGVLGATGILLGAIYMLYMAGKLLFGPLKEPPHTPDLSAGLSGDLNTREIAILTPLALVCILLGVAPRIITDTLDPALQKQVVARIRETAAYHQAVANAGPRWHPVAPTIAFESELNAATPEGTR